MIDEIKNKSFLEKIKRAASDDNFKVDKIECERVDVVNNELIGNKENIDASKLNQFFVNEDDDFVIDTIICEEIKDEAYFTLLIKSYYTSVQHNMGPEPKTYKEALVSTETNFWKNSISEEISSLEKNKTWE